MKRWALKYNQDSLFRSSAKCRMYLSKINDCDNSGIKKWILYHPRVVQSTIENDYIKL